MTKAKAEDSGHDSGQSSMNTGDDFSDRNLVLFFTDEMRPCTLFWFCLMFFFQAVNHFLRVLVERLDLSEWRWCGWRKRRGRRRRRRRRKSTDVVKKISAAPENKGCDSELVSS